MANRHRGETEIKAGGKEYTFRLSINEIADLEQSSGMTTVEIFTLLSQPKRWTVTFARQALRCGLKRNHPEMTLDACGELILSLGGLISAMKAIGEAVQASFPDLEPEQQTARPQKAVGTGLHS